MTKNISKPNLAKTNLQQDINYNAHILEACKSGKLVIRGLQLKSVPPQLFILNDLKLPGSKALTCIDLSLNKLSCVPDQLCMFDVSNKQFLVLSPFF